MVLTHTSNGQLRATRDELKVASAGGSIVRRHDLDEVTNGATLHIKAVIGLQGLTQRYHKSLSAL